MLDTATLDKYFKAALSLAEKAARANEVPVGAIVIHEGKIIGRGYNLRESKNNPVAHAEIMALQAAARRLKSWRLTDCTLVVTLEPCPMCLAACQQARIKHIIYGCRDPKGGALSLGYRVNEDPRTNHRFKASLHDTTQCSTILKDFFKARRNQSDNK